ncbi:hypothetical protein ONZ45_g13952 [Pleurotus djamor]|nr:hypothetical protein ONZ45_g13952 [Pleurotus djamor]
MFTKTSAVSYKGRQLRHISDSPQLLPSSSLTVPRRSLGAVPANRCPFATLFPQDISPPTLLPPIFSDRSVGTFHRRTTQRRPYAGPFPNALRSSICYPNPPFVMSFNPLDVEKDEDLLMKWHARDSDIPFHASDGRCNVYLNDDGRFGEHDYARWTQHYSPSYPHYGCIMRKPNKRDDPLRIMWHTLSRDDFVQDSDTNASALGRVHFRLCQLIKVQVKALQVEFEKVRNNPQLYGSRHGTRQMVQSMVNQVNTWMGRLGTLSATFAEARVMVADLQRYWLNVKAFIYYMMVAKPAMDAGGATVLYPPYKFLGTITDSLTVVEEHARAGIPVWFVCSLDRFSHVRIDSVVRPMPFEEYLVLSHPPTSKPVFSGCGNSDNKWTALALFSRDYFSFNHTTGTLIEQDVTTSEWRLHQSRSDAGPSLPTPRSQSTHQAASANMGSRPTKIDAPAIVDARFLPNDHAFVPPMIPAWQRALAKVIRLPTHVLSSFKMGDHGFPLPDPFILVPASDEPMVIARCSSAYVTWVTYQTSLIHRLSKFPPEELRMSSKLWREGLSAAAHVAGVLQPHGSSKQGVKLAGMMDVLKKWSEEHGISLRVLTPEANWGSEKLQVGSLPTSNTAREIFWELNELHLRFELNCLDAYMHQPTTDDEDRPCAIRMCFPSWKHSVPGGDVTTVACANANTGLSAAPIQTRGIFIANLAALMKTWRGVDPHIVSYAETYEKKGLSDLDLELLEGLCSRFYCQSFFNRSARAPHVPRSLPHMPSFS